MVFMVNILITKPNGIDLVLDQMMGWTDGGAQTPFIPFSLAAKLFRKAELKSFFNLNISLRILTYVFAYVLTAHALPSHSMVYEQVVSIARKGPVNKTINWTFIKNNWSLALKN